MLEQDAQCSANCGTVTTKIAVCYGIEHWYYECWFIITKVEEMIHGTIGLSLQCSGSICLSVCLSVCMFLVIQS